MTPGPDAVDDHDHDPEACLCDVPLEAGTAVDDADLPAAVGGVVQLEVTRFDETADGCDLDFKVDSTADDELPTATGGSGLK